MLRLVVACAALLVPLAACGGDSSSSAPDGCTPVTGGAFTLVAKNIQWNTDCMQVTTGDKVTFTVKLEDDGVQHNLQIYGMTTREQTQLETGPTTQTLRAAFPYKGIYHYVCVIHANMEGTIYAEDP